MASGSYPSRIVITGFMGTGKSSVGSALAKRLGYSFADLDQAIEKGCGMKVAEIFEKKGEGFFREQEKKALQATLKEKSVVVATGGGVVIDPENRRLMKESGLVVTLTARPEVILQRVQGGKESRPLLGKGDKKETILKLMREREPFYKEASLTVDTSGATLEETVQELVCQLAGR
ncbi:MAG: shikimate kinase [Deltaproteobacteria bacterium]|nr:shikimate kinase [Deltaproteobacteria bacterium]